MALGFTTLHLAATNGLTLDAGGLTWRTQAGGATLGIPAPTDGTGQVKIIARFSGTTEGWDANYELISIGWGPDTSTTIRDLLQAIVFHNTGTLGDNIVVQARLPNDVQNRNIDAMPAPSTSRMMPMATASALTSTPAQAATTTPMPMAMQPVTSVTRTWTATAYSTPWMLAFRLPRARW